MKGTTSLTKGYNRKNPQEEEAKDIAYENPAETSKGPTKGIEVGKRSRARNKSRRQRTIPPHLTKKERRAAPKTKGREWESKEKKMEEKKVH